VFTGIVETTGEVTAREATSEGLRLRLASEELDDLHHGQSIAVSGVCLTVESFGTGDGSDQTDGAADDTPATDGGAVVSEPVETGSWFEVFLAAETVAKTYLDDLRVGDLVNVERALPADGRFDGHLVQGHVDGTATIRSIEQVGEDWRFGFDLPERFDDYVVPKGSIALDGISLTVAERDTEGFEVAIVPTTYEVTTLSEKSVGDPIHLEVDVIAKYVESMVSGYTEALE
jgi:riboflavin synthase, alpha subunit